MSLKLSDYIETEPSDVLTVTIRSEGAAFALDEDKHGLTQQSGRGGDCGEIQWNVEEDSDYPLTLHINRLGFFGGTAGKIDLTVTDQEGESCPISVDYRVRNGLIGVLAIAGCALVVIALVIVALLLLRRRKVGSVQGLVYRVTLEDRLGRVCAEADTHAWKGNRLSVSQLLYLAKLPPQRVVKAEVLERIAIFAELEGGRKGTFGVAAQEGDLKRIHAELGVVGKGGFTGCRRVVIAGDRDEERIVIETASENKR